MPRPDKDEKFSGRRGVQWPLEARHLRDRPARGACMSATSVEDKPPVLSITKATRAVSQGAVLSSGSFRHRPARERELTISTPIISAGPN